MPKVHNKHHKSVPEDAVYVGRPSPWGNPFSHMPFDTAEFRVETRDEAVSRYREWITARLEKEPGLREQLISELGGKDLCCWCAPQACHADVLIELANPGARSLAYAGIGSRETPPDVLETMQKIAGYLAREGYTLRSGAAPGADSAFERGALAAGGKTEIWVPWEGFNKHPSSLTPTPEAFALAEKHHPAWSACKQGARALHARNGHQVLGASLNDPVAFIVCWTKGGSGAGGTGQALRIARASGIEIYDLGKAGELERLRDRFGISSRKVPEQIRGFSGAYRWLSNFVGHPGEPTVEHMYQAAKVLVPDTEWDSLPADRKSAVREAFTMIVKAPSPGEAKRLGKAANVRPDWDEVKLSVMRALLVKKFEREPFRSKLIATGDAEIIEDNHWGDTFWGVCRGSGENHLGRLLMEIRAELRSQ